MTPDDFVKLAKKDLFCTHSASRPHTLNTAAEKGHDVTLITAKGSSMAGKSTHKATAAYAYEKVLSSTLNVLEIIEPSWDYTIEKDYYVI
jgi:hypothetical protein